MHTSYRQSCLRAAVLVAVAALAIAPGAQAAVLQWDPGFGGIGGGTATGGAGMWELGFWYDGSTDVTWSDHNTAEFGTIGGAVSNDTARAVTGVNFTVGGYTLGGSGVITLDAGSAIRADSTTVSEIQSTLAGTNGFQKTGAGVLKLTGTNTFSGPVVISEGTLLVGTTAGTPIGGVGVAGPLGVSDSIVFDGGTLGGNAFALGTPNDRSFMINDGKTGTINPDAGGSSFRSHFQLDGSNNTTTTGKLIIDGQQAADKCFSTARTASRAASRSWLGERLQLRRPRRRRRALFHWQSDRRGDRSHLRHGRRDGAIRAESCPVLRSRRPRRAPAGRFATVRSVRSCISAPGSRAKAATGSSSAATRPPPPAGLRPMAATMPPTADDPYTLVLSGTNAFTGGVEISSRYGTWTPF